MSTDATEAGVGSVIGKLGVAWSAIGGTIVLPTIAEWEGWLKIASITLGMMLTAYMLYDLYDRRRRAAARRDAGLESQRGGL